MSDEHEEECGCFACKHGIGKMAEWELETFQRLGYFCHFVAHDPDYPYKFNAHTHGMPESWDHPDVQIVYPLPPKLCSPIVHSIVELVRSGTKLIPGTRYDQVLNGLEVLATNAVENDRDVIRIILPDKENRLMEDMDEEYISQWEGASI